MDGCSTSSSYATESTISIQPQKRTTKKIQSLQKVVSDNEEDFVELNQNRLYQRRGGDNLDESKTTDSLTKRVIHKRFF